MERKLLPATFSRNYRKNTLSRVKINVWEKENDVHYYEEPIVHHLFSCTKMMVSNPALSFNINEWLDKTECGNTSLDHYDVESIQYFYNTRGSIVNIRVCVTSKLQEAC